MTPRYELFRRILHNVKEANDFEGSDQQRQIHSLLIPVTVNDSDRCNVQSSGRLEDEYQVGTLHLGDGKSTKVTVCCNRVTRRMFVVKTIFTKPVLLLSPDYRKFTHEIAIMERLVNHPNIIEIKKAFFDHKTDTIKIVMDFAQKGSLKSYISNRFKENPSLNAELDTRHIISQICKGLAYIHAQGIVHCDIKPENIVLTMEKPPVVKVADFGISQVVGTSGFLTSPGGTRDYMAPERGNPTEDNGGYNDRADSWSVGAIVFGMLTGRSHLKPILAGQHLTLSEIVSRHEIDWDTFDKMKHLIAKTGDGFIHDLLEPTPAKRMSMVQAIKHEWLTGLDAVQQPMSTTSGSGSTFSLLNKPCSKKTEELDTDTLTGSSHTQLIENNITPKSEELRRRNLPLIEEEADGDVNKNIDLPGNCQDHKGPGNPATSNVQDLCSSPGPSQGKDGNGNDLVNGQELFQAEGGSSRLDTDVSILPVSPQKEMRKTQEKVPCNLPVGPRKSPRFLASQDTVRITRRSLRLQTQNQTNRKSRYSPY